MPSANKYSVSVKNRYQLANSAGDSSSSEDEVVENSDPFTMINKAGAEAAKRVKDQMKKEQRNQKAAVIAAATGRQAAPAPEEPAATGDRKVRNQRPNREPKGNQSARKGKRTENPAEGGDVNDQQTERREPRQPYEGERRRGQPKRTRDRQSADPKTGVKSIDKKGGGGAHNWGKPGDEWDQSGNQVEERTPENAEDAQPEEVEATEQVPEEPKEEPTITLQQYMATRCDLNENENKPARAANDGVQIKGQVLRKKQHYVENRVPVKVNNERGETKKIVLGKDSVNFIPHFRGKRNNDRTNNRNYDGPNQRRDNRNERGDTRKQGFVIEKDDFPSLGGAPKM